MPDTTITLGHAIPPSTSAPTINGADNAPMLKNRWSRFIARPRPDRNRSRNSPLDPPSRPPAPSPAGTVRTDEHDPAGREPEPDDPRAVDERRPAEDGPPAEALGEWPAAEGGGRVREGVEQVDQPDPGVGLIERLLDRPDQRRDQQPAPADRQEGQAAENRGRLEQAARGTGHRPMLPGGLGCPPRSAGAGRRRP